MARTRSTLGLLAAGFSVGAPAGLAAQVADLQVIPASVSLAVGERQEVLAVAYNSRGDVVSRITFRWAVTDSAIARVEIDRSAPPGVVNVVGLAPGFAQVTIQAGNQRRTVGVQVQGGVARVAPGSGAATILRIEPAQVYLFPLEGLQLRAVFLKDDGSSAAPQQVTWRSFRAEIADIDRTGKVVGIAAGVGAIEASTPGGLSARVQVQVALAPWGFLLPRMSLSPLESDTIRVVVASQGNRPVDPRQLDTWRSTNPDVVTVSPVGVITAMSAGQSEIVVSGFGQESRLSVSVHKPVAFVDIKPRQGEVVVPLGGTVTFEATAYTADSAALPDVARVWLIQDTSIAGLTPTGTVTGRKIGTTTQRLLVRGFPDATWTIKVVSTGLVLDRARLGLSLRDRATLRASFADTLGNPLAPASQLTWSSSDPGVVMVDPDGNLTPVTFGRATVTAATPWGVADTATVIVQGEIVVTSTREGSADLYAFERADPGRFVRITQDAGDELGPAYSPDGSLVAYATNRDGNFEIYVVDADGTNRRRITSTVANETEPTWTPDGNRIVYQSDASGTAQIGIMQVDGSGQRSLTDGRANMEPAVSPDGTRIAFSSIRDGNYEIYIMDLDGSNQRNVSQSGPSTHERVPAWLDDDTIVLLREERSGRSATWVVVRQRLGGEARVLTEPTVVISDFALSGDGTLLAAAIEAPGPSGGTSRRLFLIPIGGGQPTEVPRKNDFEQLVRPSFRPALRP